ncbi:hypothetical protein [Mesorhizobium sp.]|uniref:hypothetical protein n=1 Tax=Mesorhizobium sp. TaxID=1871066 RepID=UPI000FE75C0D|nr:hypothetical protein [Mesorhizobium sp.]RWA97307.1 MAG: hypothetical protein EOQ33_31880 [Mesorhizobium sp.]
MPSLKIAISSSAGGGWGNAHDRPPEKVLRNVEDGLVSVAIAREIYAVAINHSMTLSVQKPLAFANPPSTDCPVE